MVYDEPLSTMVEDYAQLYEELFPPPPTRSKTQQSNSLSSTRSGKSFTSANSLRNNKTASPRSTKKLGRYHTSPAASRSTTNVSRRVQMPAIHVNDGTINESVFSNNVPYNSTVCNETSVSSMVPDLTMDDMENTVVLSG